MTARRRRKSGSGPSATALIAWVGGSQAAVGAPAMAPFPVISSAPTGRMAGHRAIFLGRAAGLAAGTLLACGSVLAGATHVGDGSLAKDGTPLVNPPLTVPEDTADLPAEYDAQAPAGSVPAAPEGVSVQAVSEPSPPLHPQLGRVRRNAPVALDLPADETLQRPRATEQPQQLPPSASDPAPQEPPTPVRPTPVSPVLDPAAKEVGRVAPVDGVLTPDNPSAPTELRQVRDGSDREKQAGRARDDRAASTRDEPAGRSPRGTVEAVKKVATPVDSTLSQTIEPVTTVLQPVTGPALAMLDSLLPNG